MDQNGSTTANTQALTAAMGAYFGVTAIIIVALIILQFVVAWRIASKAGYAGVLSLLLLIPGVNFIVLLLFAFIEWPVERKLKAIEHGTIPIGMGGPPAAI